jgi:hypothetical protein
MKQLVSEADKSRKMQQSLWLDENDRPLAHEL